MTRSAPISPSKAHAAGEEGAGTDELPEDATNTEILAYLGRHRGWVAKRAILHFLLGNGHLTAAQDPGKALGKRLSRMEGVEGDGQGRYRLSAP